MKTPVTHWSSNLGKENLWLSVIMQAAENNDLNQSQIDALRRKEVFLKSQRSNLGGINNRFMFNC